MSDKDKPFFATQNIGFSRATPADELLHPEKNALVKSDACTETQFFGFNIPEERIHGFCYLWHHPHLKLVSGGPFVWQGHAYSMAHSALNDFRSFMRDDVLDGDLHDYRMISGYGVKVLEPLRRHHVFYEDAKRQQRIDLHYEAIAEPVMFGDGNHFEQPMRARGEVVLRGRTYAVDCLTVRDRSWGKARLEDNMRLPPMSWITGAFGENMIFNCNIFDQASSSPELIGTLALPEERTLNAGWIYRDGEVSELASAKKRVIRGRESGRAEEVELQIIDKLGRSLTLHGHAIASVNFIPWQNLYAPISLIRWECDGLVGHGDYQEAVWSDYLNL